MKKLPENVLSRRRFFENSLKAAAVLPFLANSLMSSALNTIEDRKEFKSSNSGPLKILILGGTSFLGPHQIAYALERGHSITTFTRGKTLPSIHKDLFGKVEQLVGDREDNLEALKGRKWDAVIDNSGRRVHWTKATAELLKDNVGLYLYTSTVSVYYPYFKANVKEDAELVLKMPEVLEEPDEKGAYEYGIMKANSEIEARKIFGEDRTIVVRPTFMVGPADRMNRFMYYPTKLATGGDIIIPGRPDDHVQFIDVRDIAEWMIRLIENKTAGTFNGVGPASPMTMPAFVYGAHAAFSSKVNYIHIDDYDFLENHGVQFVAPWVKESKKYFGMSKVNNDHSIKNGLTFRPMANTIRDINEWWNSPAVSEERRIEFQNNPQELHNRQKDIISAWQKMKRS